MTDETIPTSAETASTQPTETASPEDLGSDPSLSTILSRLNNEFLTPLVIRSLKMLSRAGKIPDRKATTREIR